MSVLVTVKCTLMASLPGHLGHPSEAGLPRACAAVVQEYLSTFRGVVLNGPRQAGKSTLLRAMHRRLGGSLLNLDNE